MNFLFVCSGNTCRSVMAEHLARKLLAQRGIRGSAAASCGLDVRESAPLPVVMEILKTESGGAVSAPKQIDGKMVNWADTILAMEPRQSRRLKSMFPRAAGKISVLGESAGLGRGHSVPDPFGQDAEAYAGAKALIARALDLIFAKIFLQEGNQCTKRLKLPIRRSTPPSKAKF